ncbi:MAG: glycosyltransferase family 2 protein [Chloroflexota bacterium]
MTQTTPEISVVICAYSDKRWDDLVAAVESVRGQTVPAKEIIVVIDHNEPMLQRLQARFTEPDFIAVPNKRTRGLSGARNSGVAVAHGDIVAFIDDDAIAAPDWLQWLAASYNDKVLGVGGPVQPFWLEGRPSWFPEEFDWVVGCTFLGMPETTTRVTKLIGCNMSFRREVFAEVGGFRTDMGRVGTKPIAGEETEFSIRVCQRWPDKELIYEPRARVQHRVPAARANWGYFRSRSYYEGLSKALVAQLVGTVDGLATERTYATRTLPRGVARGIADLPLRRDPAGVARAATIAAGLGITVYGYAQAKVAQRIKALRHREHSAALTPEDHLI